MSDYQKKKAFFNRVLTVYGRKPVLEALGQQDLSIYKVHLADSNKPGGIIDDICRLAEQRQIPIAHHGKQALSRISRNGKQDQGVAADIHLRGAVDLDTFLHQPASAGPRQLIALDRITNPQNLGMIIRSVAASPIAGILLPEKGGAPLSPLVVKASAGTLFKATLVRCDTLLPALTSLQDAGFTIATLSSRAHHSIFDRRRADGNIVYVLGNETDGVSSNIEKLANEHLRIPMQNNVESLNVAVTAALIAFLAHMVQQ